MNIKNRQLKITGVGLLTGLFTFIVLFSVSPSASAAGQSPLEQITNNCKKTAKKAVSSCPKASQQALNKASYNCKQSKNKEACMVKKANGYINTAAKGAKSKSDFENKLKAKLDKVKGSTDVAYTAALAPSANTSFYGGSAGKYQCGGDDSEIVTTKIDFGCMGPDDAPEDMSAITDLAFALIRFFSAGVGLIVVASIIFAGIQYSTSEGKPEAAVASKARVRNALIGLIIYIFGFSAIQFLVPGGLFAS